MIYSGQCHCGTVKALFETAKTPEDLGVRTCQCTFCRRQGAVNISDGAGKTVIEGAANDIERYRFGLRTADFLICKHCGTYIAAVIGEGDRIRSTINVVGLRMEAFLDVDEAPMVYDAETTDQRIARRFTKWTPTVFKDPVLSASFFGPHQELGMPHLPLEGRSKFVKRISGGGEQETSKTGSCLMFSAPHPKLRCSFDLPSRGRWNAVS